jgi:hypothetical protein
VTIRGTTVAFQIFDCNLWGEGGDPVHRSGSWVKLHKMKRLMLGWVEGPDREYDETPLLGTGLNVTLVVELTDQRQLAKGTLQTRSFTPMVS